MHTATSADSQVAITGASRRNGRAITLRLAADGSTVVVSRVPDQNHAELLRQAGSGDLPAPRDATQIGAEVFDVA